MGGGRLGGGHVEEGGGGAPSGACTRWESGACSGVAEAGVAQHETGEGETSTCGPRGHRARFKPSQSIQTHSNLF
jgi:hypothetical protein